MNKHASIEMAHPLRWPDGQKRTEAKNRRRALFKVTFAQARGNILEELRLLGAVYTVLSTDIPLRRDGLPYGDGDPTDPGCVAYFTLGDKSHAIACDRWDGVAGNAQALAKTVQAMRGIERWGSTEMMNRAFSAFQALPPAQDEWRKVFGIEKAVQPSLEIVRAIYRETARRAHPDVGGSHEEMVRLNHALAAAETELGS